jgi:isopenicillin-N N-acyltransferase-like protein
LKPSHFPFIDAGSTDHRGLGQAIGEHLRAQIRAHCDRVLDRIKVGVNSDAISHVAHSIVDHCQQSMPQYLDELMAMASGAGVAFHDLLLTGCEESVMLSVRERCTTIAFGGAGSVLLGHNEDWLPGYEDSFYVVRAKMPDGTAFLSLAYMASPPGSSVAVNSHGVAFSGNSLLGHRRPGIAKNFLLRSQVEARSLEDFERRALCQPRAIANNTMAVDRSGGVVNIEMGLDTHATLRADGDILVHTNHVLSPDLEHLDEVERPCSRTRFETASQLSRNTPQSKALMEELLRSHRAWPHSICLHAQGGGEDDSQTVAAAIVDLSDLSLAVANGPPCSHEFLKFQLDA